MSSALVRVGVGVKCLGLGLGLRARGWVRFGVRGWKTVGVALVVASVCPSPSIVSLRVSSCSLMISPSPKLCSPSALREG